MAQNRYLPFGYKVELGQITICDSEAEVIRGMFKKYADGAALKAIAEELSRTGPAYTPGKPTWNKNMVARILQNQSYLGTEKYPAILENSAFVSAQEQKEQKPYTITEPAVLKKIKRLFVCGVCGEPLGRRIKTSGGERWHCHSNPAHISTAVNDTLLLENIHSLFCAIPERLKPQKPSAQTEPEPTAGIIRLQNEIASLLDRENSDDSLMTELILQLATEKYRACDNSHTRTAELQARLKNTASDEINADRLLETVSQIAIYTTGEVSMKLKNGQTIDGRRTPHE